MNFKPKFLSLCPVPEEQKPMKAYLLLRENPFFSWSLEQSLEKNSSRQWQVFYFFNWLFFSIFFFNLSTKTFLNPTEAALSSFFQTFFCVFFFVCVSLFRWQDLGKRFHQARLIYEEASWYDGQIWEKPFFVIKNDRFLKSQKILPIQRRIQIILFFCFFSLFFFFISSSVFSCFKSILLFTFLLN